MNRRNFVTSAGLAIPAALSTNLNPLFAQTAADKGASTGRLKQGITTQALLGGDSRSVEDRCKLAASLGIKSFDFINDPTWFPIMKQYGLTVSVYRLPAPKVPLAPGETRPRNPPGWEAIGHKEAMGDYLKAVPPAIDLAAENGFPTIFLQPGGGTPDVDKKQGADNTVAFINEVKGYAEQKGVTLLIELVNSKGLFGGKTTFFDHMSWGVDVVNRVNSPRVKILFDCFHAQLMDGDVVQTIRDNIKLIGHVHVAGIPGHHCPDETQELNYHFVANALADLNYQGYICHEWAPPADLDPVSELKKAIQILTV